MLAWAKNWEGNTTYSVLPLVTSYLNAANQVALLSTVQYILQTVLIPFFAKLADMWGRSEVFVLCLLIYIISGVVFATSNTISDLCVSVHLRVKNFFSLFGSCVVLTMPFPPSRVPKSCMPSESAVLTALATSSLLVNFVPFAWCGD